MATAAPAKAEPEAEEEAVAIVEPSKEAPHSVAVVVVGASGDLAKKKTYPALFKLFLNGLLPASLRIWGYARSANTDEGLREKLRPYLEKCARSTPEQLEAFLGLLCYTRGQYGSDEDFAALNATIEAWEAEAFEGSGGVLEGHNRFYYLAVPPSVFAGACGSIKSSAMATSGWTRVVIEKPFGRDSASYRVLEKQLGGLLLEDQMYRIDHYLGKEMVQNLMSLRFANAIFEPLWNRFNITSVTITFKEDITVQGRAGYFNNMGLIRDVMQNHLLQLVTLVAMEPPVSLSSEDVRDEKVKVLRSMQTLRLEDVVLGQYEGYTFDDDVPDDSTTETFALAVMKINNQRWKGVPFIVKAGKALNERKVEIRIQFAETPFDFYGGANRNELVLRVQPDEAMYLKANMKKVGESGIVTSELDLTYKNRFTEAYIPEAYERLILDVFQNEHANFVRNDELSESWKLFTPLLQRLEAERPKPYIYKRGTRGPEAADEMAAAHGFKRSDDYVWKAQAEAMAKAASPRPAAAAAPK